jgi:menaquinone-9 beta-reductase
MKAGTIVGQETSGHGGASGLDVIVVGGGPAGAAAAIELACAGKSVAVMERTAQPHDKVCGEFLSGETIGDLGAFGVDPVALGGISIRTLRFAGLGVREVELPFPAISLTRRTLDEALLKRATAAGVLVLRGRTVEGLQRTRCGWRLLVTGPSRSYELDAHDVIVATGKHDLRGMARPAGEQSDLVGFKMYFQLAPEQREAMDGSIELALFREGYAGLSLVEQGVANLCWVVRKSRLREVGGGWEAMLGCMLRESRHLQARLSGAEPLLERAMAISPVPYGFVRHEAMGDGLWAVGDQAAVIPSFTGDGMALGLSSGRLAARMLIANESVAAYQRLFCERVRRQVALATRLSRWFVTQPERMAVEVGAFLWPGAVRSVARMTRMREERPVGGKVEECAVG